MTMIEGTLSEWKNWFMENRSESYSVLTSLAINLDSLPLLMRLFTAQDGKAPKGALRITGSIWKTKNVTPKDDLIVLYSKGSHPLVLCPPERTSLSSHISEKSAQKNPSQSQKLNSTQKLTSPYHWRCRVCSEIGQSESLERHCGVNVRQLSPVSEKIKLWFDDFLEETTFTFIPPNQLENMPGMIEDCEKIDFAIQAGNELQQLISDLVLTCPTFFEIYNPQTDHIRVSDLKNKNKKGKGLMPSLDSALKYIRKDIPPMKKAPKGGPIEIGHIFDELLGNITNSISAKSWNKGSKAMFDCTELGLSVSGTPDLDYKGIPVEMKTTNSLMIKGEEVGAYKKIFKLKWKKNYLPQLAMYSSAYEMDWMLLLLISKNNGHFSVIPVNTKAKLAELRKEWKEWAKDKKLMKKLEKYLQVNPDYRI